MSSLSEVHDVNTLVPQMRVAASTHCMIFLVFISLLFFIYFRISGCKVNIKIPIPQEIGSNKCEASTFFAPRTS